MTGVSTMRMAAFVALGAALPAAVQAQEPQRLRTDKGEVVVETIAKGLENPWGLAFLPDGRMLVTERPGGVPTDIAARGQDGLLDVALDPAFARNRLVYLSYAENRGGGRAGTTVTRARLNGAANFLDSPQVVFRQQPAHSGGNHFGSRLVFDRDGLLFVTVGDRFDLRREAQNPGNHLGKIIHITS